MNFDQYREPFERDGFVVVPGFLTADALHDLGDKLDRCIREIVPTLPGEKAFYQDPERPETLKQLHFMNGDPYFDAFRHNEHWLNLARTLLGEEVSADGMEERPPDLL